MMRYELETMARATRLAEREGDIRREPQAPFSLKARLRRDKEKPGQSPGEALAELGIELLIDLLDAIF